MGYGAVAAVADPPGKPKPGSINFVGCFVLPCFKNVVLFIYIRSVPFPWLLLASNAAYISCLSACVIFYVDVHYFHLHVHFQHESCIKGYLHSISAHTIILNLV